MPIKDINFIITSNNETRYYVGTKETSLLLLESEFGIFMDKKPRINRVFDFIKRTIWFDCIEMVAEPLKNPRFGTVIINFDKKELKYNIRQKKINTLKKEDFLNIVENIISNGNFENVLSNESILDQINKGYITIIDFENKRSILKNNETELNNLKNKNIKYINIDFPKDWKINNFIAS